MTKGSRSREAPDASPLLRVENLCKTFQVRKGLTTQRVRALHRANFEVARGEVVALVGESGSGKSTIAKLIARLIEPTDGKILFRGVNVIQSQKRPTMAYRSQVQMIFQDPFGSLNPVHTIAHHIERPLLRHGKVQRKDAKGLEARVLELLRTVGLTPEEVFAAKHPHEASGGQRQRVAIARALAVGPKLILADEPTSMLDVSLRIGVLNLLLELKREHGISFLYITHDLASARYFADRTLVMYAGNIVEGAPSGELMKAPAHPYTRLLLSAVPDPRGTITSELEGKSGLPVLTDPPPGCPFADRCPAVTSRCRESMPEARAIGTDRFVRCHEA
jgi:peptide/nickel transport system ATP-binding protein